MRGEEVLPATTTVLRPWASLLDSLDGVACDLDGDGLPEWVSTDGIWAGTALLEADPAPIAPGLDAITCFGDLDGDGTGELGIAGSRY